MKKARQVRSYVKVLLTAFYIYKFLPQGHMFNKKYYLKIMSRLRESIRQKRIELWKTQSWILQHDNAQAHTSMLVREFFAKNKTVIMPQPSYSLDLAPADFFLFPKTEDTGERKAFCYDWEDKLIVETGAVGDTKKCVSEVFRGLKKKIR